MKKHEKKIVTLLFTRYDSRFSDFVYYMSGRGYTHVSVSLDEDSKYYYSFTFKGFVKEEPQKHRTRYEQCISIKLIVSDRSYDRMKKHLEEMEANKDEMKYSTLGAFFCLLGIPFYKRKNQYFCSEFVAELLHKSEAVRLDKKYSAYSPNELSRVLRQKKGFKEIVWNPI